MSSISSLLSGSYYQLNSSNSSSTGAGANSSGSTVTQLLSALGTTGSTTGSTAATTGNSYLLDLSDEAKSYLAGLQSSNGATSSSAGSTDANATFILSPAQNEQLTSIIAKYKDEPITQDTYNQLQDDLKAAGLAPDQLSARDQMRDMNPTRLFLDALNGTDDSSLIPQNGQQTDQQKTESSNYMQAILKQWQSISTVTADTTDA